MHVLSLCSFCDVCDCVVFSVCFGSVVWILGAFISESICVFFFAVHGFPQRAGHREGCLCSDSLEHPERGIGA